MFEGTVKELLLFFFVIGLLFTGGICFGMYISEQQCQKTIEEKDELIKWRTHHAAVLEDVINEIYEHDREYFDKNIATSAPFNSLRSLYRDEFERDPEKITWDDMYNY